MPVAETSWASWEDALSLRSRNTCSTAGLISVKTWNVTMAYPAGRFANQGNAAERPSPTAEREGRPQTRKPEPEGASRVFDERGFSGKRGSASTDIKPAWSRSAE